MMANNQVDGWATEPQREAHKSRKGGRLHVFERILNKLIHHGRSDMTGSFGFGNMLENKWKPINKTGVRGTKLSEGLIKNLN